MVLGKNGTEVVTRDDQRSGFVFNPATEKIEKSNEITVRVKTGDRTDYEHDQEDSFQLYVKYSPPEKEEETAVGTGSDFQIPILALGLGLLRDDQKAEFDVGDLHMEAEASGDYQLRIKTSQDGITFSESGNTLDIGVKSFADSVEDIVNKIDSDRFSVKNQAKTADGSLDIEKIEWNIGGLKIEATVPGASDLSDYDQNLSIVSFPEWKDIMWFKDEKVKVTNPDGTVQYYVANTDFVSTKPSPTSSEWDLSDDSPGASDWAGFHIYVGDPTTVTAEEIVAAQDTFDLFNFEITASGSGGLGLSELIVSEDWGDYFYTDSATAVIDTSGYFGSALNLNDAESAQRAVENLSREISELAEQVDKLSQNMSKVSLAEEHYGRQIAIRKDIGPNLTEEVIQEESLKLKEIEILRNYHMSLLHKVMRVNEDMVRMLVLK
jgi:hypothetical protein